MIEMIKHKIRQFYYAYFHFRQSSLYCLFKKIYDKDLEAHQDIIYDEVNQGFFMVNFINPKLLVYSGREIAFFNAHQVYVFWLPGAQHSGQGEVKNGSYE